MTTSVSLTLEIEENVKPYLFTLDDGTWCMINKGALAGDTLIMMGPVSHVIRSNMRVYNVTQRIYQELPHDLSVDIVYENAKVTLS